MIARRLGREENCHFVAARIGRNNAIDETRPHDSAAVGAGRDHACHLQRRESELALTDTKVCGVGSAPAPSNLGFRWEKAGGFLAAEKSGALSQVEALTQSEKTFN